MSVPIKLRDDFSAVDVRAHARRCKDGAQVRRLLAIATILGGGSPGDAALVGGVTRQIVRDWVLRFNAEGPRDWRHAKRRGRRRSSMTDIATRWRRSSRRGRFLLLMASCAGGSSTWPSGCGMSSKCRSASRRSGMSCGPWAIAS
jgi:hypothetical protein